MKYNWPKTTFVFTNSPGQQLEHVLSEIDEVLAATEAPDSIDYADHLHEELADLHHSLESFWRTLERKYGADFVEGIFAKVRQKNQARGYYVASPVSDPQHLITGTCWWCREQIDLDEVRRVTVAGGVRNVHSSCSTKVYRGPK